MNLPIVAEATMIAKPSARPTRSTNLAVGSLTAPPMTEERIWVVPVRGKAEKAEVT
jgi:carbonic anhydrase